MFSGNIDEIQKNLLAWFDQNKRILPWRENPSLYGTWISEIMLQQTMVTTVIPYWHRFMAKFPTVQILAHAEESEVLAVWSGLGYYRRAKNLHLAARLVLSEFDGHFPDSAKQWMALPGVGAYASGAIASIGLGEVVPAVDGNARRVISRWNFDNSLEAKQMTPSQLKKIATQLVESSQPGVWNEAVMELGAVLCRADTAHCTKCPVFDHCRAGVAGVALEIPIPAKKVVATSVAVSLVVLHQGGKIFLLPPGSSLFVPVPGDWALGRDDISGLHQGLWSLPSTAWYAETPGISNVLSSPEFLLNWIENEFLNSRVNPSELTVVMGPEFLHGITRYRLKVRVWMVELPEKPLHQGQGGSSEDVGDLSADLDLSGPESGRWVLPSHNFPVSKLVAKALQSNPLGNV